VRSFHKIGQDVQILSSQPRAKYSYFKDLCSMHSVGQPTPLQNSDTLPSAAVKGKGKAIPLQSWTCPEGSRRLMLQDFQTIGT